MREALAKIVAAMCDNGFMNGWFGDVSPEFQEEQVQNIAGQSPREFWQWLDRNRYNICMNCGCQQEWNECMREAVKGIAAKYQTPAAAWSRNPASDVGIPISHGVCALGAH